ncbi:MmpS family transport accessory protein [Saccharopolyspora mangrovi]|uniref:MmpS family transport accessory protein n=1 Tax=Saccharopolyspora mangrovi TaxID=3082379 RepID=A0ABU6AAS7_9PSEU|nr:MmpS family transport accessory protein [Saccharopolyspora sp. S2-29]MEB3368678.1 MmpS family transport accessory protein [Saccharopolyspora sp. S2-29]
MTALVTGIIGIVLSWIPFVGFIGFILGLIAVVFGALGWAKAHKGEISNPGVTKVGFFLGVAAVVFSIIAWASFASHMDKTFNTPPPAAPAGPPAVPQEGPAPAPVQAGPSYAEVFGDGQAMVSVFDQGHSSNTVELPHRVDLKEGYVSVSVSRSPSVESYMEGGQGDSGSVGCRIIRNGEVVDEQSAQGQFASVSCSKMY